MANNVQQREEREVPVYLFLGFLEAGKTKFIQETFEDPRFDSGEKTLLLVCEEGELEYETDKFAVQDFAVEYLERENLTEEYLRSLAEKHEADRVVVEYNGMWALQDFFDAMPEGWAINQVMSFFDATTFLAYNRNMRQQVYDKLQFTDMVVFNRFPTDADKMEYHKIVRAASRRPDIVYEYVGGRAEYDEIEDPLPYDINAPVIRIEDRDFAFFYRDLMENMEAYNGKTVSFKGLVATERKAKPGVIVIGRHIMTCCEADITYSALVCIHTSTIPFQTYDWADVTGKITIEYHKIYQSKGPVLRASKIVRAEKPEQELATFY